MKEQPPPTQHSTTTRPVRQYAQLAAVAALAILLAVRAYSPRFETQPTLDSGVTNAKIDLNRAGRAELVQVPGLGPSLADAILHHRANVGPFENIDELQNVRGFGQKTFDKLKPWLKVESVPAAGTEDQLVELKRKPMQVGNTTGMGNKLRVGEDPIDVNRADVTALQRLPGIGPTLAERIVLARSSKRFDTVEDLRKVKGIGAKTLENIRPYIAVATE